MKKRHCKNLTPVLGTRDVLKRIWNKKYPIRIRTNTRKPYSTQEATDQMQAATLTSTPQAASVDSSVAKMIRKMSDLSEDVLELEEEEDVMLDAKDTIDDLELEQEGCDDLEMMQNNSETILTSLEFCPMLKMKTKYFTCSLELPGKKRNGSTICLSPPNSWKIGNGRIPKKVHLWIRNRRLKRFANRNSRYSWRIIHKPKIHKRLTKGTKK